MLLNVKNRPRFWLCTGWLGVLALAGGASRSDDAHQIAIQLSALLAIGWCAWRVPVEAYREHLHAHLFAGACIFAVLLQLVPLPYSVWAALPGRHFYADILTNAGIAPVARPISLAPDQTLSALLGLLPPVATLLLLTSLTRSDRRLVMLLVMALAIAGAVLGMLQISSGSNSPLRFYEVTNELDAVGLFANRNHHALLLAAGIALLGPVAIFLRRWNVESRVVTIVICGTGTFLMTSTLIVGSRSGLLTAMVAALLTFLIYHKGSSSKKTSSPAGKRIDILKITVLGMAIAGIAILTFAFGRARSINRLFESEQGELRLAWLEPLLVMTKDSFPVGVGFGVFDAAFRRYEPHNLLSIHYANMAHNDFLQLAIEGGLIGMLILAVFGGWLAKNLIAVIRDRDRSKPAWMAAASGCLLVIIIGLASIGDYPLRTPLIASIFVIACVWILDLNSSRSLELSEKSDRIAR